MFETRTSNDRYKGANKCVKRSITIIDGEMSAIEELMLDIMPSVAQLKDGPVNLLELFRR
jgi:hypothetical protein